MSLIHPLKFRTWETGHFKTPRLQTSRLQTGVFQTVVAVAFELRLLVVLTAKKVHGASQSEKLYYLTYFSAIQSNLKWFMGFGIGHALKLKLRGDATLAAGDLCSFFFSDFPRLLLE